MSGQNILGCCVDMVLANLVCQSVCLIGLEKTIICPTHNTVSKVLEYVVYTLCELVPILHYYN